jgi:hypothetical protein
MDKIMLQLKAIEVGNKLAKLPDNIVGGITAAFNPPEYLLKDAPLKAKLDAFREHVGEENYKLIAGGPSLKEMLDEFVHQALQAPAEDLIKMINDAFEKAGLADRISKEDIGILVASGMVGE